MDDQVETSSDLEERRRKKLEQLKARNANRPVAKTQTKIDLDSLVSGLIDRAQQVMDSSPDRREEISTLIKEVEEFLATHDTTGMKFKNLRGTLEKLRQKIVSSNTGKAFSFGAKAKKKDEHEKTSKIEHKNSENVPIMPGISKEIVTIENYEGASQILQAEDESTLLIKNVSMPALKIPFHAQAVNLENIKDSTLVFAPIKTSILMRNCQNLVLVAAAQQIRIHDSTNIRLHIHVRGSVIIENCFNVKVAPYRMDAAIPGLPKNVEDPAFWANVQDFNWLSLHEVSPNWSKMKEDEWKTYDLEL